MDPSILVPTPDPIPAHWGWFRFFLTLTFMAHILFMNVMVGSGIIAFFNNLKHDPESTALEKDISRKLTFIIAFTVNLGVAPLLFLQVLYGQFMYVSSLLMAAYWLSVAGLLIIAYYSAYYYKFRFDTLSLPERNAEPRKNRRYFIAATVLIFLFIGFLFTNNMTLMLTPNEWKHYFSHPHGTFLNLSEPTLFPRFLHFMIASAAMGGLFTAIVWSMKAEKGMAGTKENIDRGMKWFTYATLIQLVIGSWFLVSLPRDIMLLFMGRDMFATQVFLISLLLTVLTIIFGVYRKVWPAAGTVVALVFSMILMRDIVRTAYLRPFFEVSELQVIPQHSPLIFFLISLVIGMAVIAYVIRLGLRAESS